MPGWPQSVSTRQLPIDSCPWFPPLALSLATLPNIIAKPPPPQYITSSTDQPTHYLAERDARPFVCLFQQVCYFPWPESCACRLSSDPLFPTPPTNGASSSFSTLDFRRSALALSSCRCFLSVYTTSTPFVLFLFRPVHPSTTSRLSLLCPSRDPPDPSWTWPGR